MARCEVELERSRQLLEETERFRRWCHQEVAKIVQCAEQLSNKGKRGNAMASLTLSVNALTAAGYAVAAEELGRWADSRGTEGLKEDYIYGS